MIESSPCRHFVTVMELAGLAESTFGTCFCGLPTVWAGGDFGWEGRRESE